MCAESVNDEQKISIEPQKASLNEDNATGTSDDKSAEESEESEKQSTPSLSSRISKFYWGNEFLILVLIVILIARAYPPLGAIYLYPQITATWIAVVFIFFMAGLGLKTKEFSNAFKQLYFNCFVQIYNFGFVSACAFGLSRLLAYSGIITEGLANGMTVCGSLPMTINMVLVLTKLSGGDEASAIFNAAFGNMVGVFLSPLLILGYLGVSTSVNLGEVFYKLALRVVLPTIIGQIVQKLSKQAVDFVAKHKPYFKQAQQYLLVFIVYTVFCRTFSSGNETPVGDIFLMILFQFILLSTTMVIAWFLLKFLFSPSPKLRIMGLYGCTHKTVAMGVPLINAIYADDPNVGLYTLPLLIWHPMQLFIGTFLAPRLDRYTQQELQRLGLIDEFGNEVDDQVEKDEENVVSPAEQGEMKEEK